MNSIEDLPALLKKARKDRHLTQLQLAEKAHISRSTVLQLESGTVPDLGYRKLAAALQAVGLELSVRPLPRPLTLNELNRLNALEEDRALRETDAFVSEMRNVSV